MRMFGMERLAILGVDGWPGGSFYCFYFFGLVNPWFYCGLLRPGIKKETLLEVKLGTLSPLPWLPRQPGAVLTRTGERATAAGYRYSWSGLLAGETPMYLARPAFPYHFLIIIIYHVKDDVLWNTGLYGDASWRHFQVSLSMPWHGLRGLVREKSAVQCWWTD